MQSGCFSNEISHRKRRSRGIVDRMSRPSQGSVSHRHRRTERQHRAAIDDGSRQTGHGQSVDGLELNRNPDRVPRNRRTRPPSARWLLHNVHLIRPAANYRQAPQRGRGVVREDKLTGGHGCGRLHPSPVTGVRVKGRPSIRCHKGSPGNCDQLSAPHPGIEFATRAERSLFSRQHQTLAPFLGDVVEHPDIVGEWAGSRVLEGPLCGVLRAPLPVKEGRAQRTHNDDGVCQRCVCFNRRHRRQTASSLG